MSKSIGIIAIKGGVGKTTISSSLAADLSNNYGKKVLLIDANYSAPNLGLHMDIVNPKRTIQDVLSGRKVISAVHSRYGVDVIPGSYVYNKNVNFFKLRNRIERIKKDYDFVIIDSSPSLNDEILSVMLASDLLFVVTTPDYPTISCSLKAARLAKQRGKPIAGIIINKIRDPKHEINIKDIEGIMDIPVIAKISDDKSSVGALFSRIPVSLYNKKGKFAREIGKLSAALSGQKEKNSLLRRILGSNFKKEEVNRQILKRSLKRI